MIELEPEDHTDLGITVGGYKTADGRYRVLKNMYILQSSSKL